MKYFLLAVLYLCLVPVYFMLRNETKPKKNIILGVTLPYEARQDAAVLAICEQFLRQLNLVVLILACCRSRCSRSSAHPFSLRSASSGSSLR